MSGIMLNAVGATYESGFQVEYLVVGGGAGGGGKGACPADEWRGSNATLPGDGELGVEPVDPAFED